MINTHSKMHITITALVLSLMFATVAQAQSSDTTSSDGSLPDTRSPVIELEAVAESQADSAQVFTALVADDRALQDVTLYHRREGQQPFIAVKMQPIGDSGYYSATVNTDRSDARAIQYYVQARDESGNRTVEGYAFDPYTRVIVADKNVIASAASTATPDNQQYTGRIRWWHVALGIGVAALIASQSSGGSDGGTDEDRGVPLNVTVTGF